MTFNKIVLLKTLFFLSGLQSVREPVPAADASLGEHLAAGGHLSLHVPPLPHPLCGTSTCEGSVCLY